MGLNSLIIIFLFLMSRGIVAAACCGGGASLPSLITGDYRAQASLTGSNAAITHNANEDGVISEKSGESQQVLETLNFSASYLLNPYWQVGIGVPYKYNTSKSYFKEENSQGIGDIRLHGAYEFLPEYSFSYWKPRGFVFMEQSIPNSRSTYDAEKPLRTDSFGRGFYTTTVGFSFVKTISIYDFLFMSEIHQGFSRSFTQYGNPITVKPAMGHSFLVSGGFSPYMGNFRLGGSLLYSHEGKVDTQGVVNTVSDSRYFWESSLQLSYLMNEYSLSLTYSDQTFLGSASNTPLAKTLGLTLLRFFAL